MNKPKSAHWFRVTFDNFGTGKSDEHLTAHVTRVGRPGVAVFDIVGTDETNSPSIELDLRDDFLDHIRSEVITQLAKQIKDDAKFAMTIETLDHELETVEFWQLSGCRIVDCRFDELNVRSPEALAIHLLVSNRRIATRVFGEMVELFN